MGNWFSNKNIIWAVTPVFSKVIYLPDFKKMLSRGKKNPTGAAKLLIASSGSLGPWPVISSQVCLWGQDNEAQGELGEGKEVEN